MFAVCDVCALTGGTTIFWMMTKQASGLHRNGNWKLEMEKGKRKTENGKRIWKQVLSSPIHWWATGLTQTVIKYLVQCRKEAKHAYSPVTKLHKVALSFIEFVQVRGHVHIL